MSYSALAVTAVVGALVVDLALLRTRLVTRRVFWTAYAIVIVFQLLVNGVLTGLDVVVYDPDAEQKLQRCGHHEAADQQRQVGQVPHGADLSTRPATAPAPGPGG